MRISVAHSSNFDFQNELYTPLITSKLNQEHEIHLPLEQGKEQNNKPLIKNCDLVIAEVSYPSTGTGIELGWASMFNVPIVCIYKKESHVSPALENVTDKFIEYENAKDMIAKLIREIESIS